MRETATMISKRLTRICTVVLCCAPFLVAAPVGPALAAGDMNEADCPNEALAGFSPALPDCRAYEMVTPPFKDGAKVANVVAVSSYGSQVLANSLGAFAGTEGDADFGEGASYLLSRSARGWETSSVTPPISGFPAQLFRAAAPDAERSLWFMRTPQQSQYAKDAYVVEADGAFVRLGPLVPPAAEAGPPAGSYEPFAYFSDIKYVAASDNFSHALFELETSAPLWPGDTTFVPTGSTKVNRSLYELVQGGARPSLVGVDNKGKLISDCETDLGSLDSNNVYNAISAEGETVFFTAATDATNGCLGESEVRVPEVSPEVAELYARLGGIETVPISEPPTAACTACDVPATMAEGRRGGEFAGASENGAKVFFLTEQQLLGSDASMNLYEYDFDAPPGEKVRRVSVAADGEAAEVQGVARVSEDGSHVYFVARGALTEGPNAEGREPIQGADNLYVFEQSPAHPTGRIAFIATLCSGSAESGTVSGLAQCPSASEVDERGDVEDWTNRNDHPLQATPDGRFLVFESVADLTAGDTSSEPQIFEYDAQTGELARVSTGQAGYTAGLVNANASASRIVEQQYAESFSPSTAGRLAVSTDGSTVAFESKGALTPGADAAAVAGVTSVYEYRSNARIGEGNVFLISDGESAYNNQLFGLDASGDDIFFTTGTSLTSGDSDTQKDIYDARIVGGFPSSPSVPGCEGEACQGSLGTAPVFGPPASASVTGSAALAVTAAPSASPVPAKPKSKPLTRARQLAKALKACRGDRSKGQRTACERKARERYGARMKAKSSGKRGE